MSSIFEGFADSEHSEEIMSLAIGKVKENWDAKHPGMVKVEYFLGSAGKNLTSWVPVVVPYAFKESGTYFMPEVGSTVVLGFDMGDRSRPMVIGCLWNDVNPLPKETPDKDNFTKRIHTKGGNGIALRDEGGKESLTLYTKGEEKVVMSDEDQKISLMDKGGKNAVYIQSKDGTVHIKADSKIVLEAGGNEAITIDGKSKKITIKLGQIEIKADQTLQIKGQNTKMQGSMVEIKGDATFKVQAGSMAEIKGAMVKLN